MNEKNNQEAFDLEEQIEESKASLERINGWISSCDSKAGTILALTGVLLTIIFTNNGFLAMNKIMQKIFPIKNAWFLLHLILFTAAVIVLITGIVFLIKVLLARIDSKIYEEPELVTDSILFFGSISSKPSYKDFQSEVLGMGKKEYLKDLLSQVYINSKIAHKKYLSYNTGVYLTIIGFISFVVIFLIVIYVY